MAVPVLRRATQGCRFHACAQLLDERAIVLDEAAELRGVRIC
jgi:hypothetical protein